MPEGEQVETESYDMEVKLVRKTEVMNGIVFPIFKGRSWPLMTKLRVLMDAKFLLNKQINSAAKMFSSGLNQPKMCPSLALADVAMRSHDSENSRLDFYNALYMGLLLKKTSATIDHHSSFTIRKQKAYEGYMYSAVNPLVPIFFSSVQYGGYFL